MLHKIPDEIIRVGCNMEEYLYLKDLEQRKIYLSREISSLDDEDGINEYLSDIGQIIKFIIDINDQDRKLPPEDRKPIKIYINSPGGNVSEGFPLVSAIELSKTPVYTINIGTWASMAFLIGIAGHKRFALPHTEFLLHEGQLFTVGTVGSVQDTVDFNKRYKEEVIKTHILKHSKMVSEEYDATSRRENYMLPKDALKYGFIDEIVDNIDTIL